MSVIATPRAGRTRLTNCFLEIHTQAKTLAKALAKPQAFRVRAGDGSAVSSMHSLPLAEDRGSVPVL